MATKTPGSALGYLNRLFVDGTASGLPDDQLLDRFLATHDSAAFEALMARHGPMVLRVCRGVLRNSSDAEDAFQATFLVLVKKARTLRGRANLGGWLHLVAYRIAIQAKAAAARRSAQERRAGELSAMSRSHDPVISDELLPALHAEIARLPEKVRLAVVLCDLQGIPQDQAAESLRWSERTLRRRLVDGRERLKARLGRRGLQCSGAVLTAVRLADAGMVVPPAWRASTLRAVLELVNSTAGAGAVSAAAQSLTHEVLGMMFVQKLTIAAAALLGAGLMAWTAVAALVPPVDDPKAAPAAVARRGARAPVADPSDAFGVFPVRGRVLDPDGNPVAGAEVSIRHWTDAAWAPGDPPREGKASRVTTSGADGRFHLELDKSASDWPYGDRPAWHGAQIAAAAPGLAMSWVDAGSLLKGDEATLRLVLDDVPIRGRVVDAQGRPVSGATARLVRIGALDDGADPGAMLASGELAVIRRILTMLERMPASRVAATLTAEGVPPPDAGRLRTDRGILHTTSGVWHATSIANIARNPLLRALVVAGRRSMGDQLRFASEGPRTLEGADYRAIGRPKVVANKPEACITGVARFAPLVNRDRHDRLLQSLDERGGMQKGKPRSQGPTRNPLGGRVFDAACG